MNRHKKTASLTGAGFRFTGGSEAPVAIIGGPGRGARGGVHAALRAVRLAARFLMDLAMISGGGEMG